MKKKYTQNVLKASLGFILLCDTSRAYTAESSNVYSFGSSVFDTKNTPAKITTTAFDYTAPGGDQIAEAYIAADTSANLAATEEPAKTVLINFNNVSMMEYIRFVSRISNRNFLFDDVDLQFNVTIISEEPATIDNVMTALAQELMIHDLMLIEDGNNLIIHKNPKVNAISKVVPEGQAGITPENTEIVTQVFRLNTLDPDKAASLLKPLSSANALIEPLRDTSHLIVTDLASNVRKVSELIKSIDSPNSGMVIGQYVSVLTSIDVLISLVQQIVTPISQDQVISFVPHSGSNSIFIVGSPFMVERSIAILQYLDQEQGATRILNLKDLEPRKQALPGQTLGTGSTARPGTSGSTGSTGTAGAAGTGIQTTGGSTIFSTPSQAGLDGDWYQDENGNWILKPNDGQGSPTPPKGTWIRDSNGKWIFTPDENGESGGGLSGPKGQWIKDKDGKWIFQLSPEEAFAASPLGRQFTGGSRLPGGAEKENQFYIYKLQYRKGETVEPSLRQIADTLQQNERGNQDLISTLRSVQWLTAPNSLVFSGTPSSLDKARALVAEFDKPLRQVFIEMLILETSLEDSLEFGVTYGTRFGGGDLSGGQTFFSGQNRLNSVLGSGGVTGLGQTTGLQNISIPNGTNYTQTSGLNLAVIGQKLTHCGTEFGTIAALVKALHDRTKDEVVSNPKILVEDGSTAEIFVGINTPYRTQAIANDFGNVITSNFEYRDVGTKLKVTPYLGNGDIIALDIEEEVSTIITGLITNADTASTSPGPTTRINRTATRVHIPDTYFLIISGMMQDEEKRARNQIPCLGGVPVLGAAFSEKVNRSTKRNLMIFIRPKIVDTEDEVDFLTKHQQDIYKYKNCLQNSDEYETIEALDLLNLKKTLHPEDVYDCDCECD